MQEKRRSDRGWKREVAAMALVALSVCWCAAGQTVTAYRYRGDVALDLHRVWFSSFGSYLAFSEFPQGLYLRELHNNTGQGALLANAMRVELVQKGAPVVARVEASPVELRMTAGTAWAAFTFERPNLVRLQVHGGELRLSTASGGTYGLESEGGAWEIHGASSYRLKALHGLLHVTQQWTGTHASGGAVAEFAAAAPAQDVDAYIGDVGRVWDEPQSLRATYDEARAAAGAAYRRWLQQASVVAGQYGPTAEQAAYILWSSAVAPSGFLTRPAMLMSKNWMGSLWSWDNCFNAMALVQSDPVVAWDQFMIPLDDQDGSGQLPDTMNDAVESWKHTKPPVQGWVLAWMMRHGSGIGLKQLAAAYGPLARQTEWYFRYRDRDHDGLPEYEHGDDSGWDNATIFLQTPQVESPDLAALLVLQMDMLAEVARRLGKNTEAHAWTLRSDALLKRMLAAFWTGDRFVARAAFSHQGVPQTSLILYLPLLLGRRLPAQVRERTIDGLLRDGRFLTANGLATEELDSAHYEANGYWRGPIWAPTTMMLAEGLEDSGRKDVAELLRKRFCAMAERSGFPENFEAVSGSGAVLPDLDHPSHDGRDPAYTWTASVYLIFAQELSSRPDASGRER
jgi:putative isomerase